MALECKQQALSIYVYNWLDWLDYLDSVSFETIVEEREVWEFVILKRSCKLLGIPHLHIGPMLILMKPFLACLNFPL